MRTAESAPRLGAVTLAPTLSCGEGRSVSYHMVRPDWQVSITSTCNDVTYARVISWRKEGLYTVLILASSSTVVGEHWLCVLLLQKVEGWPVHVLKVSLNLITYFNCIFHQQCIILLKWATVFLVKLKKKNLLNQNILTLQMLLGGLSPMLSFSTKKVGRLNIQSWNGEHQWYSSEMLMIIWTRVAGALRNSCKCYWELVLGQRHIHVSLRHFPSWLC